MAPGNWYLFNHVFNWPTKVTNKKPVCCNYISIVKHKFVLSNRDVNLRDITGIIWINIGWVMLCNTDSAWRKV